MQNRDRFDEQSLDRFDAKILGWKIGTVLMKNPWMENRDRVGLIIGTVLTRNPWMESRDRFDEEFLDGK